MSAEAAIVHLLQKGDSGALVVNDDSELVGVVTAFDFLHQEALEGSLLPMEGSVANIERVVDVARKICEPTVSDIMTPNPCTVHGSMGMRSAASKMTELRVQRLPVVDDDGKVLGVLTAHDVMRDLHRVVQNLPPSSADDLVDMNP